MDQRASSIRRQRCAIYTRKSLEEGLEKEFISLHAHREERRKRSTVPHWKTGHPPIPSGAVTSADFSCP